MKRFDEKFADRVREVFDAYEEEVDPVAMETMRRKLHVGRGPKSVALFWFWAAASVIFLASTLVAWNYFNSGIQSAEFTINDQDNAIASSRDSDIPLQNDQIGLQNLLVDDNAQAKDTYAPKIEPYNVASRNESVAARQEAPAQHNGLPIAAALANNTQVNSEQIPAESVIADYTTVRGSEIPAATNVTSSLPTVSTGLSEDAPILALATTPRPGVSTTNGAHDPLQASEKSSRSALEVVIGSAISYTNNQFAEGIGFVAGAMHQWRINEALSFAVGGLLSVNRFEFNPATNGDDFGAYLLHASSADDGNIHLDVDMRNSYNWTAIDIPMNAKVHLGGTSSRQYNLTFGVSSLIFLQQNFQEEGIGYRGQVFNEMGEMQLSTFRYIREDRAGAFERVDFARLMNLAVGYEFTGRNNAVEVELFMKYPLGTVTSRDIQLGMGGITFKYSIGQ